MYYLLAGARFDYMTAIIEYQGATLYDQSSSLASTTTMVLEAVTPKRSDLRTIHYCHTIGVPGWSYQYAYRPSTFSLDYCIDDGKTALLFLFDDYTGEGIYAPKIESEGQY